MSSPSPSSSSSASASGTSSPSPIAAPRPLALASLSPVAELEMDLAFRRRISASSEPSYDDLDSSSCPSVSLSSAKHRAVVARRASHNAVERARRDKLNARILQLSTILPNLAGLRRPSRLAITKSSIAQVHIARRRRLLAAQHLRQLHAENTALRGEINGWRARAGVPTMPDNIDVHRGETFELVLSGAECAEMMEPVDSLEEEDFDARFGAVPGNEADEVEEVVYHPYAPPMCHDPAARFAYAASSVSPPSYNTPLYPSPPSSAEYLPPYSGPVAVGVPFLKTEEDIWDPSLLYMHAHTPSPSAW
ncbi:hypothetical protein C8F01DRAFT_1376599 [Mycena amicta]|nr:hypothetical protein C8F01DRAFT_1376599 [Mycena amicta]